MRKRRAPDVRIAYQNKDIAAKLFGNRMEGKALSLFGLKSGLKVKKNPSVRYSGGESQ